jgi:crotonobetainyl-CoA:carnitine CoA-transferase CaiB-like acyl-CoA transferase
VCLSHSPSDECVRLLGEQQIVVGAVRGFAQAQASEDVLANGLIADVEPRAGEAGYRTLRLPYTMAESPVPPTRAAPRVGEHGTEILLEAGFAQAEVDALRAAGVLR